MSFGLSPVKKFPRTPDENVLFIVGDVDADGSQLDNRIPVRWSLTHAAPRHSLGYPFTPPFFLTLPPLLPVSKVIISELYPTARTDFVRR